MNVETTSSVGSFFRLKAEAWFDQARTTRNRKDCVDGLQQELEYAYRRGKDDALRDARNALGIAQE